MINSHSIYIEKLDAQYKSVFKKISDYVYANNLDEVKNEEILSEVIDTFLSAQSEGRPVDQVIGDDLKGFCEQLCSEIGIKSRVINFLEEIHFIFAFYAFLCVIDVLDLITKISDGENVDLLTYKADTDIIGFFIGGAIVVLIGYIGHFIIKRYIFTKPDTYKKLSFIIKAASFLFLVIIVLIMFSGTETEGTPLWISILICAVFLISYRFITRESRKYKKENRISLFELANTTSDFSDDMEKTELKRFEKLKKKRNKKGQPEPTFEEFLDLEEKDCTKWDKRPPFYVILALAGAVGGTVFTYFVGGFESTSDMFFFIGVILLTEALVMLGLYKLTGMGTRARLDWIKSKRI